LQAFLAIDLDAQAACAMSSRATGSDEKRLARPSESGILAMKKFSLISSARAIRA
jgi:hypothetical protein